MVKFSKLIHPKVKTVVCAHCQNPGALENFLPVQTDAETASAFLACPLCEHDEFFLFLDYECDECGYSGLPQTSGEKQELYHQCPQCGAPHKPPITRR